MRGNKDNKSIIVKKCFKRICKNKHAASLSQFLLLIREVDKLNTVLTSHTPDENQKKYFNRNVSIESVAINTDSSHKLIQYKKS